MKTAICPGSFDPVTIGHLQVIRRSARLFDRVIVAVMQNYHKQNYYFTALERVDLLRRCLTNMGNVEVVLYDGLLADMAKEYKASAVVKGLRAVSDFEDEFQQALINKKLNPEFETVFIAADAEHMFLSSSVVKQVCEFGGDISEFVPPEVRDEIIGRIRERKQAYVD